MTFGEYMANVINEGKQADPNELQRIMTQQAKDMGYEGVSVRVAGADEPEKTIESTPE